MSATTRTSNFDSLFPIALLIAVCGGTLLMVGGFITSETQYREGVRRAATQIEARLPSSDLKDAAMLVLADSKPCIQKGMVNVHESFTSVFTYVFSRQQRAKAELAGYDQANTCYRERLKAMQTVGQSAGWTALMEAAK